jgi:small GTP-binding protein
LARESLRELIQDARVPAPVREALADDYRDVAAMLEKIEQGHVHIAAVGRVSVGKSSLLNALLGEQRFRTSPLHGETRRSEMANWQSYDAGGVYLIDTPGINEVDGEAREKMAYEVASRVDLVLFVLDGDMTDTELAALRALATQHRPIILVLNKVDRYTAKERALLVDTLAEHTAGIVERKNIVWAAAEPAAKTVIVVNDAGEEQETSRQVLPDVAALKERLWDVLEKEGKTLVALNASLFAGNLSDQVAQRILTARKTLAGRVVRMYCVSKGVGVALNPIPVADLFAAAIMDVTMVLHLSRLYGLPVTRKEAGALVQAIAGQIVALMGTVWAVHLVSSALKVGTGGLSVVVTAGAQGAVAYYATYVVGRAAERYLAQGKSWGEAGPKQVVREIVDSLDRDSILAEARKDILVRLKGAPVAPQPPPAK